MTQTRQFLEDQAGSQYLQGAFIIRCEKVGSSFTLASIQSKKFLTVTHATKAVLAERDQTGSALNQWGCNLGGNDNGLIDGAAHAQNARGCVDRRTDHREIKPGFASDISIEHIACMERERKTSGCQPLC